MQIVFIHCILFELCVREKKKKQIGKKERKRKEKKKEEKYGKFLFNLLDCKRINGSQGVYFALDHLRVFIPKSFGLLYCGYLGAASIL